MNLQVKSFLSQFFYPADSLCPFFATVVMLERIKKFVVVWQLIPVEKLEVFVTGSGWKKSEKD